MALGRPLVPVYCRCPMDAAHLQAQRAGPHVLHKPRDEPWGRSGRYEDLGGDVIELTQQA